MISHPAPVLILASSVIAFALTGGCAHDASSETVEPTSATARSEPEAPRHLVARGSGSVVDLVEGGGPLIDGNAPPPPPGQRVSPHPAVHGSCTGEVLGCSRAGAVVRGAETFDDIVRRLGEAGFDVVVD